MTEIKINTEQKVHVKLAPVTPGGHPATLDGKPTFNVTEGDATVEADEDGLGAFLISGAVGTSKILVSADADLTGEVQTIEAELSLVVSDPMANNLGLVVDEPVNK